MSVNKLANYPYCRPNVFACTDMGLFMHVADTVWEWIYAGSAFRTRDFCICPSDTSLWIISRYFNGSGDLEISHNSGADWSPLYEGYVSGSILWSQTDTDKFYFAQSFTLDRADLTDSTFEHVLSLTGDAVRNLAAHPSNPWIYVGGWHHVGRYDEATGDSIVVSLPSGITYSTNIAYAEGDGLLIGTSQGIFRVADDLTEWQEVTDSVNTANWLLYYTSDNRCLAGTNDALYLSGPPDAVSNGPTAKPSINARVYPNPCNGGFFVYCDRPARFQLFDLLGHCVYTDGAISAGARFVNLPELSSGTYYLKTSGYRENRVTTPMTKVILIK